MDTIRLYIKWRGLDDGLEERFYIVPAGQATAILVSAIQNEVATNFKDDGTIEFNYVGTYRATP